MDPEAKQITDDLKRVQALISKNELAEAIPILESIAPRVPNAVSLLVTLAQAYEGVGKYREALATWKEVRRLQPSHSVAGKAVFRILMGFATARMNAERRHGKESSTCANCGARLVPDADTCDLCGALVPTPGATAAGEDESTRDRESDHRPADQPESESVAKKKSSVGIGADLYKSVPRVYDRRRGDRRSGDRRRPGGSGDYDGPERRKGERRVADRRTDDRLYDIVPAAKRATGTSQVHAVAMRAIHLTKKYKRREVVSNVNLTVRQGEIVGLLGPNGAGKTTTFYMIVGLVKPNQGTIYLGEEDITNLPMYKRARKGVGYLAQEASIFAQLTVESNLHAVLEYQGLSRAERQVRVDELIEEFRLETVRKSKGYTLSGGERRRTEIARAIATRPRFFLLDEPFAGVDPIAVEDIQEIVASLKNKGIGVLITDHNVHETLAITDRAYLLYEGKILMQGSAEALASDPEVRKRYLGENFKLERYATES